MKTLLLVSLSIVLFSSCEKWEKECTNVLDITGKVEKECCASGPNRDKRNCECQTEYLFKSAINSMSKKEKKDFLKTICN